MAKSTENMGARAEITSHLCTVYDIASGRNIYCAHGDAMTKINPKKIKNAQTALKRKKGFTFALLLSLLNCSTRSGRFRLKQWGSLSSYNHNGRYYTLPSVPHFDENGLWHYKNKYFSKHGTLKNTVVHLVRTSTSGLTGNQIGEIVGLSPRSFLHHFSNTPGIRREKHGGLYVYFSDDDRYKQQVANRLDSLTLSAKYLTDADAVIILVAVIAHHNITIDNLAMLPEIKEKNFSTPILREFFERHGFKKKTPNLER